MKKSINIKGLMAALAATLGTTGFAQTNPVIVKTYSFTGAFETFVIPSCVSTVTFDVKGAEGGDAVGTVSGWSTGPVNLSGGDGGRVRAVLNVTQGDVLNIFVGGKGQASVGGWNGGGNAQSTCGGTEVIAAGGGGASDVRRNGFNFSDRIIVAGGGGGAAGSNDLTYQSPDNSGAGGGLSGADATNGGGFCLNGGGGTQTAGGVGGNNTCFCGLTDVGGAGSLGLGGTSVCAPSGLSTCACSGSGCVSGGGGGGGYYGGGAGLAVCGGGGGSSWSHPSATNVIHNQGFQKGHGEITISFQYDGDIVGITPLNPEMCEGGNIVLTASGVPTFTWVGSGSNNANITVSPNTTETYTVTGTNTLGCVSVFVTTVNINPLPVLQPVVSTSVLCLGNTAQITAFGAVTYSWSTGSSTNVTSVSPSVTTTYTVSGTSNKGCVHQLPVVVNVNSNVINVTNTVICNGGSANLSATGCVTYTWSNGSLWSNMVVAPAVPTVYTVEGTDVYYCKLTNTVSVGVNPKPSVTALASQAQICRGESVELTASGANTYLWSNGSASATQTLALPVDVVYTYTVTGTNTNGCSNQAVVSVNVGRCAGINEMSAHALDVKVYPNPAQDILTVELNNGMAKVIEVVDLTGRVIISKTGNQDVQNININTLSDGVYYVVVKSEGHSEVIKVIKH